MMAREALIAMGMEESDHGLIRKLQKEKIGLLETFESKNNVCQKCGHIGYAEALVYCFICHRSAEHRYCLDEIPRDYCEDINWSCPECVLMISGPEVSERIALLPVRRKRKKLRLGKRKRFSDFFIGKKRLKYHTLRSTCSAAKKVDDVSNSAQQNVVFSNFEICDSDYDAKELQIEVDATMDGNICAADDIGLDCNIGSEVDTIMANGDSILSEKPERNLDTHDTNCNNNAWESAINPDVAVDDCTPTVLDPQLNDTNLLSSDGLPSAEQKYNDLNTQENNHSVAAADCTSTDFDLQRNDVNLLSSDPLPSAEYKKTEWYIKENMDMSLQSNIGGENHPSFVHCLQTSPVPPYDSESEISNAVSDMGGNGAYTSTRKHFIIDSMGDASTSVLKDAIVDTPEIRVILCNKESVDEVQFSINHDHEDKIACELIISNAHNCEAETVADRDGFLTVTDLSHRKRVIPANGKSVQRDAIVDKEFGNGAQVCITHNERDEFIVDPSVNNGSNCEAKVVVARNMCVGSDLRHGQFDTFSPKPGPGVSHANNDLHDSECHLHKVELRNSDDSEAPDAFLDARNHCPCDILGSKLDVVTSNMHYTQESVGFHRSNVVFDSSTFDNCERVVDNHKGTISVLEDTNEHCDDNMDVKSPGVCGDIGDNASCPLQVRQSRRCMSRNGSTEDFTIASESIVSSYSPNKLPCALSAPPESATIKTSENYNSQSNVLNPASTNDLQNPAIPLVEPTWSGSFDIGCGTYGPIMGHLSLRACKKVCDAARCLPSSLCLEQRPRLEIWPISFNRSPPSEDNIGLFFFPGTNRVSQKYVDILNEITSQDLALRAILDDAELLIFSSIRLPEPYKIFNGDMYLWGVFRAKQNPSTSSSVISSCKGQTVDMDAAGLGELSKKSVVDRNCLPPKRQLPESISDIGTLVSEAGSDPAVNSDGDKGKKDMPLISERRFIQHSKLSEKDETYDARKNATKRLRPSVSNRDNNVSTVPSAGEQMISKAASCVNGKTKRSLPIQPKELHSKRPMLLGKNEKDVYENHLRKPVSPTSKTENYLSDAVGAHKKLKITPSSSPFGPRREDEVEKKYHLKFNIKFANPVAHEAMRKQLPKLKSGASCVDDGCEKKLKPVQVKGKPFGCAESEVQHPKQVQRKTASCGEDRGKEREHSICPKTSVTAGGGDCARKFAQKPVRPMAIGASSRPSAGSMKNPSAVSEKGSKNMKLPGSNAKVGKWKGLVQTPSSINGGLLQTPTPTRSMQSNANRMPHLQGRGHNPVQNGYRPAGSTHPVYEQQTNHSKCFKGGDTRPPISPMPRDYAQTQRPCAYPPNALQR